MPRLDQEREKKLTPNRFEYAEQKLGELGFDTVSYDDRIEFGHKGATIKLFPYSGWHTGKTIKDGRGISKLIKQLQ